MTDTPQAVTAAEALNDISDALKIIVHALKRQPDFNVIEFEHIISDSCRGQNDRVRNLIQQIL